MLDLLKINSNIVDAVLQYTVVGCFGPQGGHSEIRTCLHGALKTEIVRKFATDDLAHMHGKDEALKSLDCWAGGQDQTGRSGRRRQTWGSGTELEEGDERR